MLAREHNEICDNKGVYLIDQPCAPLLCVSQKNIQHQEASEDTHSVQVRLVKTQQHTT